MRWSADVYTLSALRGRGSGYALGHAMATGKTTESDKDCEWMLATCKSRLAQEDVSGAKAWIFTARSLFPNNFKVQVVN